MKAMGNFTVDFNWTEGKCQKATITSNAGAELKVRCTRGAMELAKARITVNGAQVKATVDENGIATIPCAKDDVIEIDFTTEAGIAHVVVNSQKGSSAVYDLNGRRVNDILTGKIYIQDGKKSFVK